MPSRVATRGGLLAAAASAAAGLGVLLWFYTGTKDVPLDSASMARAPKTSDAAKITRGFPQEAIPQEAWNAAPAQTSSGAMSMPVQEVPVPASPAMASGFIVGGRVTGSRGSPVPEAIVIASNTPSEEKTCGTDKKGGFRLSLPTPGHWKLVVEADGFMPWERDLEIQAGQTDLEVVLTAFGTLAGIVDSQGMEARHFQVIADSLDDEGQQVIATCRERGEFETKEVPPGQYDVHLLYGGMHFPPEARLTIPSGERVEVQLRGPRTGTLDGRAVLPSGTPLPPDGMLELAELESAQVMDLTVRFREDGTFEVSALPEGSYEARLAVAGLPRIPAQQFTIGPPWHTTVGFVWPDGIIDGHIGGGEHGPAARMQVILWRLTGEAGRMLMPEHLPVQVTESDGNGYFLFNGLDPGRYMLRGQGPLGTDTTEVEITTQGDRQYVSLWLEQGAITMRVMVMHNGKPMEGVRVDAIRLPYMEGGGLATTGEGGEARLESLKPGTYIVTAMGDQRGAVVSARTEVRLVAGSDPAHITLDLR